jgi:SAM-dependent methyltransferase
VGPVRRFRQLLLRRGERAAWKRFGEGAAAEAIPPSLLPAATADPVLAALGEQLLLLDAGLGLFRLVHLYAALVDRPSPRTILSVGSGGGFHEAFLARLFPSSSVVGIDLRSPLVSVPLPNLSFRQGNLLDPAFSAALPAGDFVFSIECLEHIEKDEEVLAAMAALVRPGGALYLEVPFATEAEIADPEVRAEHFRLHEHVRPGYTAAALRRLCERNGLEVVSTAGAFWFPMQPLVWFGTDRFGPENLRRFWPEFLELAERDVRSGVPAVRTEATAIKVLAVRR